MICTIFFHLVFVGVFLLFDVIDVQRIHLLHQMSSKLTEAKGKNVEMQRPT